MSTRIQIINDLYTGGDEDTRLNRSRQGQLEFITTIEMIHRHAPAGAKVLEIGAGTGRYSIALAKEGYDVNAIELVDYNLEVLRRNAGDLPGLCAQQGDALDLSRFADNTFDVTLSFGPMYHLYEPADVHRALDEALRVTKPGGVVLVAFLSVYAIMSNCYLNEGFLDGLKENFTEDYTVRHYQEQFFTGYDIVEFEQLFAGKPMEYLTTVAADGVLELAKERPDFVLTDDAFDRYVQYHLATCEKRELLGMSSHLLVVGRKTL